jgi:cobalt-zinc-cadmium resistance protein CzcA
MKRVIQIALAQPLMVLMATLLFILAGTVAFKNLSVEAFPDVTDTQVTVIALYPGRAAEEVEKQVTLPIEVALSGLPNSIRVFSHTQFGLSFTVVTYDDKADVNIARQQVNERLRGISLPLGVEADVMPNATPVGEVMRYRLRGDGKSTTELRTLQDWVVERTFRQVPGVADVVGMGSTRSAKVARLQTHLAGLALCTGQKQCQLGRWVCGARRATVCYSWHWFARVGR